MNHLVGEEPRNPIDCDSLLVKEIEQHAQRITHSQGHMDHFGTGVLSMGQNLRTVSESVGIQNTPNESYGS